jgi:hypothetical protein
MMLANRIVRSFAVLLALGLLAALLVPLATRPSHADQQSVSIAPGDQLAVTCTTSLSGTVQGQQSVITCAAPAATQVPPTQAPASGPTITQIKGVQEGGSLSGKANIEAIVGGSNIATVVFKLEGAGQPAVTHTEKTAPYFFLGDNNGVPNGWDTTKSPNGDYMLTVTATNKAGQRATAMVHFHVANQVTQPQPTATAQPTTQPTTAPAPTATPVPGGMLGACSEPMDTWHAPVVAGPDGKSCATGHEHGDAPPAWIAAAGYSVSFHGHFNTSPKENSDKHAAMKGFLARFNNVDIYFRVHAASNPLDRSARYHSYEVWARDPSGGVSHWQGWYNTGDPIKDRFPRRQVNGDPGTRPIMLVVDQQALNEGIGCEQWYSAPGEPGWGWDFGWTICGATVIYQPNENATAGDQSTWILNPNGTRGGTRRLEASWYASRPHPSGAFVATQFGEIVSGMSDARCAGTTTKFGVSYQNTCLEQYIAPTMVQVAFPDNAAQKDFDTTGVKIPN